MDKTYKDKIYDDFFENEGYLEVFKKNDARILFNCVQDNIIEFIVEKFESPNSKQSLYLTYTFDFGNCNSNWNELDLADVVTKIFIDYRASKLMIKKIFLELSKIEEWRPKLRIWLYKKYGR